MRYVIPLLMFLAPIAGHCQPISLEQTEADAAYLIDSELLGYYSTEAIEVLKTSQITAEVRISVVRNSQPLSAQDGHNCQVKGSPYYFLLCQPSGHEFSVVLYLNYVDTRQGRVLEVPLRLKMYPFDANTRIPKNRQPGYVIWPSQNN